MAKTAQSAGTLAGGAQTQLTQGGGSGRRCTALPPSHPQQEGHQRLQLAGAQVQLVRRQHNLHHALGIDAQQGSHLREQGSLH